MTLTFIMTLHFWCNVHRSNESWMIFPKAEFVNSFHMLIQLCFAQRWILTVSHRDNDPKHWSTSSCVCPLRRYDASMGSMFLENTWLQHQRAPLLFLNSLQVLSCWRHNWVVLKFCPWFFTIVKHRLKSSHDILPSFFVFGSPTVNKTNLPWQIPGGVGNQKFLVLPILRFSKVDFFMFFLPKVCKKTTCAQLLLHGN